MQKFKQVEKEKEKEKYLKNNLWPNKNVVKSKDFEMKKYKTRQEEKKERKKFESNHECDDEHENYKKHKYDPGRIMLTLITIVIKMNRNVFF